MSNNNFLLSVQGVNKRFGGLQALSRLAWRSSRAKSTG